MALVNQILDSWLFRSCSKQIRWLFARDNRLFVHQIWFRDRNCATNGTYVTAEWHFPKQARKSMFTVHRAYGKRKKIHSVRLLCATPRLSILYTSPRIRTQNAADPYVILLEFRWIALDCPLSVHACLATEFFPKSAEPIITSGPDPQVKISVRWRVHWENDLGKTTKSYSKFRPGNPVHQRHHLHNNNFTQPIW